MCIRDRLRTARSGTACDPGPRTLAIRTASDPGKLSRPQTQPRGRDNRLGHGSFARALSAPAR
eukprot:8599032-Alexandrium_andersonii.AAC.1